MFQKRDHCQTSYNSHHVVIVSKIPVLKQGIKLNHLKKFIRRYQNQIIPRVPKLSIANIIDQEKITRNTIPYIQGQSESIKKILSYVRIQTVFRPLTTLRKLLSKPKDATSL